MSAAAVAEMNGAKPTTDTVLNDAERVHRLAQIKKNGGTIPLDDFTELTGIDTMPEGMTFVGLIELIVKGRMGDETVERFDKVFPNRPNDGAHAAAQILSRRYGMVLGKAIDHGFFGIELPETRDIAIGVGETMQIPWGNMELPTLPGVEIMLCDGCSHPEFGRAFSIHITAPKKYAKEIKTLFDEIDAYLRTNSIYRGKAIIGALNPGFYDFGEFDPNKVVLAAKAQRMLDGSVYAVLKHTKALRKEGIPRKKAVLLYGGYGTGKTSVTIIAMKKAIENGWTAILAKPGERIEDVIKTARLYAPAVVVVEDLDTQASTGDSAEVSKLLDTFDGAVAKGGELVIVMTTNHLSKIHKGMMRPGRLDAVIPIEQLDREGTEQLIRMVVPEGKLASDVDFDAVYMAMAEFPPAFMREAVDRAQTYAISRLDGDTAYVLTTEDLVDAATSLNAQLDALNNAGEGEVPPTLDQVLNTMTLSAAQHAVHGAILVDGPNGHWKLSVPELEAKK